MPTLLHRLRRLIVELLLWAAALAGLAAVVLVICAHLFGLSVILFRTGSMEPTIPQGAASLVREIPASEIAVGDVVTVDRTGELPVTHRVTSVEDGEAPHERVITMQGDANASEDPEPYTVTEVRRVLWSAPGMAEPIHRLSEPWVMGTVTVGAALLVGWAFWPRGPDGGAAADGDGADDSDDADEADQSHRGGRSPRSAPARPRHAAPTAVAVLVGVVGLTVPATAPAPAAAATADQESTPTSDPAGTEVEVITGEHLELISALRPQKARNLAPGDVAVWELGVSVDAPSPGTVRTGLSLTGQVALDVVVESCARPWGGTPHAVEPVASPSTDDDGEQCTEDRRMLHEGGTFSPEDDAVWELGERPAEEQRWLRLQVSLAEGAADGSQDLNSRLHVHVEGEAESLSTSPGGDSSQGPGDDGQTDGGTEDDAAGDGADSPGDSGSGGDGDGSGDSPGGSSEADDDGVVPPRADGEDGQLATTGAPLLIVAAAGLLSMGLGRLLMMVRGRRTAELAESGSTTAEGRES